MYDICIIGAGAAGMTAAITAKETRPDLTVVVLERGSRPGRKIRASGNGRCNLSNVRCGGYKGTLEFFQHIGVLTRTDEEGRIYPYSEDAKDVEEALSQAMHRLGALLVCDADVTGVRSSSGTKSDQRDLASVRGKGQPRENPGFTVTYRKSGREETLQCSRLLIAAGGKAGPKFGTTGDGGRFARAMGHTQTRLAPGLTAVLLEDPRKELSGVRAKARVTLAYRGQERFQEDGEIQFTPYGISGICVFDLSREMTLPEGASLKDGFRDYRILVDFLPGVRDVRGLLSEQKAACGTEGSQILRSLVKAPLAEVMAEMAAGDLSNMAELLKAFPLQPSGLKGWDFAQVTRGGVPLDEINIETMESKILPGLYFAGEVLDYDGPCGGYNLQFAWETGIRAGKGIAEK